MTVGGFGSEPDPVRGRIEFTDEPGGEAAEEVLATGRPAPRWLRGAALAAAVLVGGCVAWYAIAHVGGSGSTTHPAAHARGPQLAPPLFIQPGGVLMHRSSDIACDTGLTPWVRALRPTVHTGLHLLVGGTQPRRVGFDSGRTTPVPVRSLHRDEWVSALSGPPRARLATTSSRSCDLMAARVLRLRAGPAPTDGSSGVVADESQVWVVRAPPHVLHPVTGGRDVALPLGFSPVAATRGFVAGDLTDAMDSGELGIVDTRTGLLRGIRGRGVVLAAGAGRLFWTEGCNIRTARPCLLHSTPLQGGRARTYRLPSSPGDALGRVDAAGRRLAFTLGRQDGDGDGDGDASVVVLDLVGGRLTTVPGIEVTTRYQPQYDFAPTGHWLVASFARGGRAVLAAWRPGLRDPVKSVARVASPAAPPVVVLRG